MTAPLLYVAPDGSGDATLWRRTDDWRECIPIARKCDLTAEAWELLLAGALVANRWPATPTTSHNNNRKESA